MRFRFLEVIMFVLIVMLIVFFGAGLHAQTITISPAGAGVLKANTGKVLKQYQMLGVVVCPAQDGLTSFPIGQVYTLASIHKFSPLQPEDVKLLLQKSAGLNFWKISADAIEFGGPFVATMVTSGTIAAPLKVVTAIIASHSLFDWFRNGARAIAPDPTAFISRILNPEASMDLSAGCKGGVMMSLYGKNFAKDSITLDYGPVHFTSSVVSTDLMPRFDRTQGDYK